MTLALKSGWFRCIKMYNPRWPHTLSVYVESLDANGLPVTDENGDPIATAKTLLRVEYDSRWNPVRGADGVGGGHTEKDDTCAAGGGAAKRKSIPRGAFFVGSGAQTAHSDAAPVRRSG